MENNYENILEMNQIKEKLKEYAYTEYAKKKIDDLSLMLSEKEVKHALHETTEAKLMLEKMGNPPFTSFEGLQDCLNTAKKGDCLSPEQLELAAGTLTATKRMKDYLNRSKFMQIGLPYYEENLSERKEFREAVAHMIRGGQIEDHATKTLMEIRRKIGETEAAMREKADQVMRRNQALLSDSFATMRNGRLCIPIKKEAKGKIAGSILDQSSTGATLFLEPSEVGKIYAELEALKLLEENEERNILYTLTGEFLEDTEAFEQNQRVFEKLDFAFAKAALSVELGGVEPELVKERRIWIKNGRHPLIPAKKCVPLDFRLDETHTGMIITGPNTGGKTVAMKTVGLISYMTQCGLHPVCDHAELCLFNQILCDIGDGQNISENLSTFSAHITNVMDILSCCDKESLVLMDELGSGTDPAEGMGIAIAVLKELHKFGCTYLVTTHYPEVKTYAETTEGVMNARMAFDRDTLRPLYRLEIGKSGESCALYIAKKLGMPQGILKNAQMAAYGEITDRFEDAPEELQRRKTRKLMVEKDQKKTQERALSFRIGDCVMVYPEGKLGIICKKSDENGNLVVQMKKEKRRINHKRIKLHVAAAQLYPEDYDFSIIFDSVANRKARHTMSRKYDADVSVEINEEHLGQILKTNIKDNIKK